jgi:hypothetical protein
MGDGHFQNITNLKHKTQKVIYRAEGAFQILAHRRFSYKLVEYTPIQQLKPQMPFNGI